MTKTILTSLLTGIALVALSGTQFSRLKNEMFPLSERAEFIIYMDMPKGTAISETEHYAKKVSASKNPSPRTQ